jgi:hypothetical protein
MTSKSFFIGVIVLFLITSPAYAVLTPEDINFACMNPFTIAKINFGSSGILTKLGDGYDISRSGSTGILCECETALGVPRIGIPIGMSLPTHIFETTLKPYYFPSLEEIGEAGSAVEGYGDMDSEGEAYTYTHLINLNIMLLLDIFTDILCVSAGGDTPLDIG